MVYWGTHGGGGGEVFQTWCGEEETEWWEFEFGSVELVIRMDGSSSW